MLKLLAIAATLVVLSDTTAHADDVFDGQPMTFVWASNGGNCEFCSWIAAQGIIEADTPTRLATFLHSTVPAVTWMRA
jgi:hypothetical protein